ncbi:hypothetical protein SK128_003584 [Halocaridina rubra]|uniref:Uncharacterized protein n=1 Tax=Halocaridina rubra TaxID=373956 RepID=A0AAN8X9J1_HALRR
MLVNQTIDFNGFFQTMVSFALQQSVRIEPIINFAGKFAILAGELFLMAMSLMISLLQRDGEEKLVIVLNVMKLFLSSTNVHNLTRDNTTSRSVLYAGAFLAAFADFIFSLGTAYEMNHYPLS